MKYCNAGRFKWDAIPCLYPFEASDDAGFTKLFS